MYGINRRVLKENEGQRDKGEEGRGREVIIIRLLFFSVSPFPVHLIPFTSFLCIAAFSNFRYFHG